MENSIFCMMASLKDILRFKDDLIIGLMHVCFKDEEFSDKKDFGF